MSRASKILVLVAYDKRGKLCANSEGNTRLSRCIDRVTPSDDSHTSQELRYICVGEIMFLDRPANADMACRALMR